MTEGNGKFSYEQSISNLEKIVRQLEHGETSLEEGLQLFKDGIVLIELCQQKLDTVEKELKILTQKKGEPSLEPFGIKEEDF